MRVPQATPNWTLLLRIARSLIRQVNCEQTLIDHWTFGGGTAMMLQINHRESRDVDIFLPDPQMLGYFDLQKRDFEFEIAPSNYESDGSTTVKLSFNGIGEIDFIVGQSMTPSSTVRKTIEDESVEMETISEIIVKKIHYRGAMIKPRDIFDIAAAAASQKDTIIRALRPYHEQAAKTLATINRLNPAFVNAAIAALAIKPPFLRMANESIERAKAVLSAVQ